MPTSFSFEFYGDVQVERTLTTIADHAQDARPAFSAMARRFTTNNVKQFASEGAHASGGWAPLSPAYAAWKARHYPGRKILARTGRLRRSLTRRPFGVERIEAQSMVIGSDVYYGRFHQTGVPENNLPRRRPVELPENERREWTKIMQRFLLTGRPS
jgi:phage gpG-like protein